MIYENLIFLVVIIVLSFIFSFSNRISSRILGFPMDQETIKIVLVASFAGKLLYFWWGLLLTIFVVIYYYSLARKQDNDMEYIYDCFWRKFIVYWLIGNIFYLIVHYKQTLPVEEIKIISENILIIIEKIWALALNSLKHPTLFR